MSQQSQIAGIIAQLAGFYHIVPLATQPFRHKATNAPINQESHCSAVETAESESFAMTARA